MSITTTSVHERIGGEKSKGRDFGMENLVQLISLLVILILVLHVIRYS